MIEVFCLIGIFLVLLLFLTRKKRPAGFPKGPTPLPIFGNLLQVGLSPHSEFMHIGKKYGGIFAFDFGAMQTVVITDIHILREILVKPAFAGRPRLPILLDRCGPGSTYCRGIISSELRHWSEQKKFIQKNLRDFKYAKNSVQDIIQEEATEFMERLRQNVEKPLTSTHLFNAPILNSVWRIFTGVRTYQTDPKLQLLGETIVSSLANYIYAGISFAFPALSRAFPNLSGYNAVLKFSQPLCTFITEVFMDHKATYVPGQARDIMDSMWEEIDATTDPNSSFYKEEGERNVVKSLEDLFVGGADSIGTSMNWIFLLLSLHPELQEKIYQEILEVVGISNFPELSNRPQMILTESFIMEMLRFVGGPLPLAVLHSTLERVSVAGYILPKDTVVITNIWAVLNDPAVWGDPEIFRPDRFILPDGTLNRSHEAFIPFSYGKRICVAEKLAREEMFLFTTSILQKFRVSLHGQRPSLKCYTNLILCPPVHQLVFHEREP